MSPNESAPIELIALDTPYEGVIAAYRRGEPDFLRVNGISDAIMAALSRGVDLLIPASLLAEMRDEFPPELPPYIKVPDTASKRSARSQVRLAQRWAQRIRDSLRF